MESPEKNSETKRRRSRKTKRKRKTNVNAKTLVLGLDSYSFVYSYLEHEAETCRRELDYRYHQDLRKSDGFDVDMYKIRIPEQITPCDLDIYSNVAIKFGKFVVDDYNQKQPEGGIKLAFVKPLKCNIRHSRGITYYITFEAKLLMFNHSLIRLKFFMDLKRNLKLKFLGQNLRTNQRLLLDLGRRRRPKLNQIVFRILNPTTKNLNQGRDMTLVSAFLIV